MRYWKLIKTNRILPRSWSPFRMEIPANFTCRLLVVRCNLIMAIGFPPPPLDTIFSSGWVQDPRATWSLCCIVRPDERSLFAIMFSFMSASLAANIYCSCSLRTNTGCRLRCTGRHCNYVYYHFLRAHLRKSIHGQSHPQNQFAAQRYRSPPTSHKLKSPAT